MVEKVARINNRKTVYANSLIIASGVPRNFVRGVGVQQIQFRTEDTENGDLGGVSPLAGGSGGRCNSLLEISFHIVKFS